MKLHSAIIPTILSNHLWDFVAPRTDAEYYKQLEDAGFRLDFGTLPELELMSFHCLWLGIAGSGAS